MRPILKIQLHWPGAVACLCWCWIARASIAQEVFAVTADGKLVRGGPEKTPWIKDVLHSVAPEYPPQDRQRYHQGKGVYRLMFNTKTGWTRDVIVRKSTGWATLDNAVIDALRQWRVRPGKWRQFEFPVTYRMARSREDAMEHIRQLQTQRRR